MMVNAVFEAIPTPETIEHHGDTPAALARLLREPQEPIWPALRSRLMATGPSPDPQQLERFRALMADDRWPVKVARMLVDRKYAYDRIVLAYTSPNPELLALAQHLFKVFQARGQSH